MGEDTFVLGYDASVEEEWQLFASSVIPEIRAGSPLYELLRVAYYTGSLAMMGKTMAISSVAQQEGEDSVAPAVDGMVRELEEFADVATDTNVAYLVSLCNVDHRPGGLH